MKVRLNFKNLDKIVNPSFYPLFGSAAPYLAMQGGGGSGKSVFAAQKLVFRAMTESGHFFGAFRKNRVYCKGSVWAELKSAIAQFGATSLWRENKTDLQLTFLPNNNVIRCFGLDDPEKIKSIKDANGRQINLTGSWFEEATEFQMEDIAQIGLRTRGFGMRNYEQVMFTFNPIIITHPLRGFIDNPANRVFLHRSTYKDNRFINASYKQTLDGLIQFSEEMYRIYALGEWGVPQGRIYHAFQPTIHVIEMPAYTPALPLGATFDFNLDPMTCTIYQFNKNTKTLLFVDEIVRARSNTQAVADLLVDWVRVNCSTHTPSEIEICGDSTGRMGSANSRHTDYEVINNTLRAAGVRPIDRVPRSNPGRFDRFTRVNMCLAGLKGATVRWSPRCKNAINDYGSRMPAKDKNLPSEAEELSTGIGHSADNCDYAIFELFDQGLEYM